MDKRLIWADIVRILAVYFIVVLHVASIPNPSQTNFIYSMGITIADTCVPLLVMLSGALLIGRQESYQTFLRKRVSRVVVPWVMWTATFTAIVVYFQARISFGTIIHVFHLIFIPFFWFIVLVCSLYAITPALRIFARSAKTRDIVIVILLWYAALSLLPTIRNTQAFPLHVGDNVVQLVVNFIGYFLLGYLISKIKLQKKYVPLIVMLFLLSFLGRSFLEYYSTHSNQQLISGSGFIDPTLVVFSASFFSLLYLGEEVYQKISNSFIRNSLPIISRATLGIYFAHYLFLNREPLPMFIQTTSLIHISYNIDMFINAFIFYIISLFIILVLVKIPLIKYLVT